MVDSLIPKAGAYLVPIKVASRQAEGIDIGATVEFTLIIGESHLGCNQRIRRWHLGRSVLPVRTRQVRRSFPTKIPSSVDLAGGEVDVGGRDGARRSPGGLLI